jgi:uncharacterized protein (TIGR03435 family)
VQVGRFSFFLTAALIAAGQQPATRNQFEVVSIRPSTLSDPHSMRINSSFPGTTLNIEYPLSLVLYYALNVKPVQLVGLPPWVDSTNYAFVARTTQPATLREMWPMLLPVLEERFHLQFHRDKKEMQAYELSVAKAGKLPPPQSKNCFDPSGPLPPPVRAGPGQRLPTVCGDAMLRPTPGGNYLYGSRVTMATVVSQLTDLLGRPVVDKTGFAETFDFDLKFAPDESTPALPPRSPDAANPSDLPNVFTALQDQLGLKVKSARDPVEVIVIDRIERPTEN